MNYIEKLQKKQDEIISVFNQLNNDFEKHLREYKKQSRSNKVTDRIKTFEDACDEIDIDPDLAFDFHDEPHIKAFKKLIIIARAINEGWVPDWDNTSQQKWYPWFRLSSGFGFSDSAYYCTRTGTGVSSRLCFQNEELSNYVGTQFIDVWKDYLTI